MANHLAPHSYHLTKTHNLLPIIFPWPPEQSSCSIPAICHFSPFHAQNSSQSDSIHCQSMSLLFWKLTNAFVSYSVKAPALTWLKGPTCSGPFTPWWHLSVLRHITVLHPYRIQVASQTSHPSFCLICCLLCIEHVSHSFCMKALLNNLIIFAQIPSQWWIPWPAMLASLFCLLPAVLYPVSTLGLLSAFLSLQGVDV